MRLNLLTGKWEEDKPKKKNSLPERDVEKEIDSFLKSNGIYSRVIKSDGRKLPNGKWIPSRQGRGISDRIAILHPNGRFLAIEIKASGKRSSASEEQIMFLTMIIQMGGIGVVADSVECVKKALAMSKQELLDYLPEIKKEYPQTSLEPLF